MIVTTARAMPEAHNASPVRVRASRNADRGAEFFFFIKGGVFLPEFGANRTKTVRGVASV